VVFTRARVAVFVDGCFWHGCPEHGSAPKSNAGYWAAKIEGNRQRDIRTDSQLEDAGWRVIRLWEHEQIERAALEIERAVQGAATRRSAAAPAEAVARRSDGA
jgi:DNA mismatch endonuclease (patch repair protein)